MGITNAVVEQLDAFLRPRGFSRKGRTWRRAVGCLRDVIDVQASNDGSAFTINVGVLDTDIYRRCWGKEAPDAAALREGNCTVRTRLGELMEDRDIWWSKQEDTDEVLDAVQKHALPFLEQMHAPSEMEAYLASANSVTRRYPYPPDVISLALLVAKRGDRAAASALLQGLKKKITLRGWRERVDEVLAEVTR